MGEPTDKQIAVDERLKRIRSRLEGVTGGPWRPDGGGGVQHYNPTEYDEGPEDAWMELLFVAHSPGDRVVDSKFIAHARQDIPFLLSLIDDLKALTEG